MFKRKPTYNEIVAEVERRIQNHKSLIPFFEGLGMPDQVEKTQQGLATLGGVLKWLEDQK